MLLKNADGILPLDRLGPGSRIAVIGRPASQPGATTAAAGLGQRTRQLHRRRPAQRDPRARGGQAGGCHVRRGRLAGRRGRGGDAPPTSRSSSCATRRRGQRPAGHGDQRRHLRGPVLRPRCRRTRTSSSRRSPRPTRNTVVVALTGGPVLMPWLDDVKGVLEMWYPGQGTGRPRPRCCSATSTRPASCRRPSRVPSRTSRPHPEQYPGKDGKAQYCEGLQVGYRWFDARGIEPLFPFGFGLSYTDVLVRQPARRARAAGARRDGASST